MLPAKIGVVLAILAISACSSHYTSLEYGTHAQADPPSDGSLVASVSAVDERGTPDNWLGAIRGGYGNPLKKIYTDGPTADAVRAVFEDALQARGMLGTPETSDKAVEITISKLDCSYYFNREAHAHLSVTVVTLPERTWNFTHAYKTDNSEGGLGAGIFGDPDYLAEFAERTLNETIEKILSDPDFLAALSAGPAVSRRSFPLDRAGGLAG